MKFKKSLLNVLITLPLVFAVTGCDEEDDDDKAPSVITNLQCKRLAADSVPEGQYLFCYSEIEPTSSSYIDFFSYDTKEQCQEDLKLYRGEQGLWTNAACIEGTKGSVGAMVEPEDIIPQSECKAFIMSEHPEPPKDFDYEVAACYELLGEMAINVGLNGGALIDGLINDYRAGTYERVSVDFFSKDIVLSWYDSSEPDTGDKPYQEVYDWLVNRGVNGKYIDDVCTSKDYTCEMKEYPTEAYQGLQPTITYEGSDKYSATAKIDYYPKQNGRFFIQQMHNIAPNKHQVIGNDNHSASMHTFNGAFNSDVVYMDFIKMHNPDASGYKVTTDSMGRFNDIPLELKRDIVFSQTLKVKNESNHLVDHETEFVFDVGATNKESTDAKIIANNKFIAIVRYLKDGEVLEIK